MNLCTVCSCQAIHWFRDLSYVFIVLNSSVNPFLYAWRLPNFREAIKALVKRSTAQQLTTGANVGSRAAPQRNNGCTAMTIVSSGVAQSEAKKDDMEGAKVNEIAISVEERL